MHTAQDSCRESGRSPSDVLLFQTNTRCKRHPREPVAQTSARSMRETSSQRSRPANSVPVGASVTNARIVARF